MLGSRKEAQAGKVAKTLKSFLDTEMLYWPSFVPLFCRDIVTVSPTLTPLSFTKLEFNTGHALLERVKATLQRRLLCREHTYAGDRHDNHSNMFSERKEKKKKKHKKRKKEKT